MTANTIVRNAHNVVVTGKGAQARKLAFVDIAPHAYSEAVSRVAVIASLKVALGKTPSESDIRVAKGEYVIGRSAARLAVSDLPKGTATAIDKLNVARELVELYAAPPKDGVATRKLRKGQKGRRTIAQHRVIRAAEEAWSQVLAEVGVGKAQTQGERNAKKRNPAPQMAGARGGKASKETLSQLATPAKPLTADDACGHVVLQMAALLAFCNKNAKLIPAGLASAIIAAKKAVDTEEALRQSVKA